jgi:hypothetical protein
MLTTWPPILVMYVQMSCDYVLASKSVYLASGKLAKMSIEPMSLGIIHIEWVNSIKYPGITITEGNSLGFKNGLVKQSFFLRCNCTYANAKLFGEIVQLALQESYCLPILTYVVAVENTPP